MRNRTALAVALAALSLGGCVAGMAVGAVSAVGSAAARRSAPAADPNVDVGPAAREACAARAAQVGAARVIDVEPRGPGKAIVWGSVGEGAQRRSFECRWAGKIVGFTVRAIGKGR
jgi:hypothetical protein